ncbi:MAG: Bacterial lipid biosynthesis acyltransferase [Fibrobacterota bacterium]|jgi:lauroyl/myristoyl acyltransferase
MDAIRVPEPKRALHALYRTSTQELVRILRRRYHRLDQSDLKDLKITGPTFYLSYHFGNWEWLGGILSNLHGDFRPVTRSIRSPRAHRLVQSLRQDVGMNSMIDHQGLRGGRAALDENAMLAFLADQTPPGSSRPGVCLEHSLPVSTLPEWWAKGKSFRWITGHLISSSKDTYALSLFDLPSAHIEQWDQILDQHLCPILRTQPQHYFGWWHHRLISRIARANPAHHHVSRET